MTSRRLLWVFDLATASPVETAPCGDLPEWEITLANGLEHALLELKLRPFDAIVGSFPIGTLKPETLLEQLQQADPLAPIIICDPAARIPDAVRLAHLGAYQCMGREIEPQKLLHYLDSAHRERTHREQAIFGPSEGAELWRSLLVGDSHAMQEVIRLIRLVGNRSCTVLISGETGTGKEVVARSLHMASSRAHLPIVAVNCSALPEHLLETELFGHVKGAFTGAANNRAGRFEQANKSTLFLDEIGDLPLDLQAKLLRVLQEREFQRLGSSETIKVNVRVIAASNVNLLERVNQRQFRDDLYYRLNVVPIRVPSLRERVTDIPLLVGHFVDRICRAEDIPLKKVGPGVMQRLCSLPWPGNVRQLQNAIEMAIALSGDRSTLYPTDFHLAAPTCAGRATSLNTADFDLPEGGLDFEETVNHFERTILDQALRKAGGNKTIAADLLGLKRTTLLAKLRNLGESELEVIPA
jgi:DNA-binding NtrC family response regulator